jgi:hypothetical protein
MSEVEEAFKTGIPSGCAAGRRMLPIVASVEEAPDKSGANYENVSVIVAVVQSSLRDST